MQTEPIPTLTPPTATPSTTIATNEPSSEVSVKEPIPPAEPTGQAGSDAAPKDDVSTIQFDAERLKFAMVAVGTAKEGWLGYGVVFERSSTGFDVLTADHVVDGLKSLMVQAWQGEGIAAKLQPYMSVTVMHRAPEQDLAWLRVRTSASDVVPLSISQHNSNTGQTRLDLSSERAESRIHRHEIDKLVSAKRDGQAQPVAYLRLKNRIEPGLSGGGLVDANGKWIGIASGNSQNQAHYVAPEEIIAFMKAAGLR